MSKPKEYTAQEMREMAEHLILDISDINNDCNVYRNKKGSFSLLDCEWALQQAADAEDELEKVRKRLDDVIKECQNMKWEHYSSGYPEDVVTNQNGTLDNVICVAMGEEVTDFFKCHGKKRESLVQLDELIAERDVLKARLEAVIKKCNNSKWMWKDSDREMVDAKIQHNSTIDSILKDACYDGGEK